MVLLGCFDMFVVCVFVCFVCLLLVFGGVVNFECLFVLSKVCYVF